MTQAEQVYLFKPANHWNYIPKEVYVELQRFYGPDWLMTRMEEVKILTKEKSVPPGT